MVIGNLLLAFALIFCLRVADVTLGTIRTVYIVQGRRLLASAMGFVEVSIFIFAIAQVMRNLDSPMLMLAYSGGFATGTYLGLLLEEKLAMGYAQLRVISTRGEEVAQALWARDFGGTVVPGHGRDGAVSLVFSIVPRRRIEEYVAVATAADAHSFVNISDSRYFFRGYVGHGHKRK